MDRYLLLRGVAAVAPALALSFFGLAMAIGLALDPCHTFGDARGVLTPTAECPSVSASSQTLGEHVVMTLAIHGSLLAGSLLGAWGIGSRRPLFAVAGAWILALVAIPLFLGVTGGLVVLASALVLVASRDILEGASLWAARALSLAVAGLLGFQALGAIVSGITPFLWLSFAVLIAPAVALWATWAPRRAGGDTAGAPP